MPSRQSSVLPIRVRGDRACFTRPELKAERVSYEVMTPSAARGVLEAILWKPAIRWQVERIHVLNAIRWTALRRNEVASRAVAPSGAVIESGGAAPMLLIEDERAQRNMVALRDVDYVIEARFELTDRAGPEETPAKFQEMFRRRLTKGQHYHQPYLGMRELIAEVEPVEGEIPPAIAETRDLGLMLWDLDFRGAKPRPLFFPARLERGVLNVPAWPAGGDQ